MTNARIKISYSNFYGNNSLNFGLGNQTVCIPDHVLEDVYTFDFQARYFMEQIPAILLDAICNEYSVFYINDSDFPISQSYQIFENNLVSIIK